MNLLPARVPLPLDTVTHADALTFLRGLPDNTVNCVVTSPPYFGLRDYGVEGQIGLEDTPAAFVAKMVELFREVRRVLRADGTCWVNLGDSYNGSGKGPTGHNGIGNQEQRQNFDSNLTMVAGLAPKNLLMIPARVAIALQDDEWVLRSEIVWHKPNPMPECLDPETTVFIRRNGWVSKITLAQLANLKELPEILSPDGWVQVRHVWKTQKPAMKMEVGKVEHVICSPDHRFPVSSDRRRIKTRLERAEDIRHEGYADYLLYSPIDRYLPETLTTWMGRPLDYNLGYLVGVYAAEGGHGEARGFRVKFTININEDEFSEKIKAAANCVDLTVTESVEEQSHTRNLFITEEWFTRTVDAFVSGTVTKKALNIEVILNTPRAFRQGMLDGYVEGDGSDRKGGGWITASASRRLRDDVSTLASSVGIITSKGWREALDSRTGKTYNAHSLWTPYMTRRKVKSGTEGVYQVPPRRRKDLGDVREMIDIEVDGHVFLIGDGLVTHNSVTDRCTKSHEMVYLLAKAERYFYDADAIREKAVEGNDLGLLRGRNTGVEDGVSWHAESIKKRQLNGVDSHTAGTGYRNKRTVWTIATEPTPFAHFATFPQKLIEPMILAGCPHKVCTVCGAPWVRRVEVSGGTIGKSWHEHTDDVGKGMSQYSGLSGGVGNAKDTNGKSYTRETLGFTPTCAHTNAPTRPGIVLDPFMGSGTTGLVARRLGRHYMGSELNASYVALCRERLAVPFTMPMFEMLEVTA